MSLQGSVNSITGGLANAVGEAKSKQEHEAKAIKAEAERQEDRNIRNANIQADTLLKNTKQAIMLQKAKESMLSRQQSYNKKLERKYKNDPAGLKKAMKEAKNVFSINIEGENK